MRERKADPAKIRRHFTCSRAGEDSATYRVFYGGARSEWRIVRNDNELESGGCRFIAWGLHHDAHGCLHENERKTDCLDDLAKRFANVRPIFVNDLRTA